MLQTISMSTHSALSSTVEEKSVPILVWIIDDNTDYSSIVSSVLNQSTKIECTRTFLKCEDAIEVLRKGEVPPRVILLDIELPGMGGIAAIKPLKKISPSTHILIITAYNNEDYIRAAMGGGASGYLLKDSSATEFTRAIKSVLSGGMIVHPMVLTKMVKMIVQEPPPALDAALTQREKDILRLVRDGLNDKQIASRLGMSYNTLLFHTKNIHDKMGVHSRRELIVKAVKRRII